VLSRSDESKFLLIVSLVLVSLCVRMSPAFSSPSLSPIEASWLTLDCTRITVKSTSSSFGVKVVALTLDLAFEVLVWSLA